eukprot:CAMPEP_0115282790 /NCGR_PEP_ID=MMETSP0270-20121206/60030_1 /TAXON_ID=71861 /ORGANISM="Scrippsiella trochoidea, Strain CCMP3099" /LENGTH=83 /DNA_ID=CAMNT_0002699659 /DNA_START=230 /DNA_END=481 /DNA_ORIENTATION=-
MGGDAAALATRAMRSTSCPAAPRKSAFPQAQAMHARNDSRALTRPPVRKLSRTFLVMISRLRFGNESLLMSTAAIAHEIIVKS